MTLAEIQQAIERLTPDERDRLRLWLAQRDAGTPTSEAAPTDTTAEKLGRFAGRTFAEVRKRLRDS
jgi:hypothetical protein